MLVSAVVALLGLASFAVGDPIAISVNDVKLSVLGPDGKVKASEVINQPSTLTSVPSANVQDTVSISLSTVDAKTKAPVNVRQVFLGVRYKQLEPTFVFQRDAGKDGKYALELDIKSQAFQDALKGQPGNYSMTIYAAGPDVATPVAYQLGTAAFVFPENLDAGRVASEDPTYSKMPEIHHVFRDAEKMPPSWLSLIFSGLVLAPWLLLLGLWASNGANISNLFASSSLLVFGSAFSACLVAVIGLFYLYWTRLNLFQLLGYGSVLSVVTSIIGRQALVARAALKTKI
ncbi:proteasome regulatory particle base subunit [Quaeritorhiza haematococci]|nr:proteasome regulatory particle base subunit [Quaeritorhiza haematococci]